MAMGQVQWITAASVNIMHLVPFLSLLSKAMLLAMLFATERNKLFHGEILPWCIPEHTPPVPQFPCREPFLLSVCILPAASHFSCKLDC